MTGPLVTSPSGRLAKIVLIIVAVVLIICSAVGVDAGKISLFELGIASFFASFLF